MSGSREIDVFPRVQFFTQSHFFSLSTHALHSFRVPFGNEEAENSWVLCVVTFSNIFFFK